MQDALSGRVLVVDDQAENLSLIAELLDQHGFDVQVANSGKTALRLAALSPHPDLILLDIMMPEMDGYEVFAQLRSQPGTAEIPVIFVTALNDADSEIRALDLGAVDFLSKPVRPSVLLARVRTHITLKQARELLQQEHQTHRMLASAIIDGLAEGVCLTDHSGKIISINPAFTAITGYTAAEVLGANPRMLQSGAQGHGFYRNMWVHILREGHWQGEIVNRHKDGTLLPEWLSISAVRNPAGEVTHYAGIFSDLTERQQAAKRIEFLSSHDTLTELPNRTLFTDRLAQSLLAARRYERNTALIVLDLDRFRLLNDSLGANNGDRVLEEIARRLNCLVRSCDTVGRLSGNEFGLVMGHLGHENDAIALAQRMLAAIAEPIEVAGQTVSLTASIGISIAPKDGDNSETLLKCADIGLQRAKKAGRNTFRFYAPEMDANAARHVALETALKQALSNRELSVYYQPQISLDSGRLLGMEALLRWHNPTFGSVSPAEFIPIAEESGLILPIGEWVLREACRQTKAWLDLGLLNLRIAVNLSVKQFHQPGLLQMVSDILASTGLPANALELEITESTFIDEVDEAIALCRDLKGLGIKISLDDFGTGYSSLAYLSRFPFDKLKIDQGFVRDITENPVNAAIATAAIVMARSLNLTVLAEGVETEAQASFLRGRRCDAMQGYLFSRPLPPEQFVELLHARKQLPLPADTESKLPTLLLLDDEPNILKALTRLFRREGYHILSASTPSEAFDILAKHAVQVILCDQRMPEMSGTAFLTRVRQLYPDIVRLVLTGYTDLESVRDAINKGAVFKFLTKPWDDDELREQVREAFRIAKDNRWSEYTSG